MFFFEILILLATSGVLKAHYWITGTEEDTCIAPDCFDEVPQCTEIAHNGSCFGGTLGASRGVNSKKIFLIAKNLLMCRPSCLQAFMENKDKLTERDIDIISEAGGLGLYVTDPFGISFDVCNHRYGFTLPARQLFINFQLYSLRALFMPQLNSRQYTKAGIKKNKIPIGLFQEIMAFRNESLQLDNWQYDPYCLNGLSFCSEIINDMQNKECMLRKVNSQKYYNLTEDLAMKISNTIRPVVEDWVSELNLAAGGPRLKMTGAPEYGVSGIKGIRRYRKKAWLSSHVDCFDGQMAVAVLHLAHETEKPWPLHIYDYDRIHRRIFLKPGDIFILEGCRLPHGRVKMLTKGWYDNIIVHYRETSH